MNYNETPTEHNLHKSPTLYIIKKSKGAIYYVNFNASELPHKTKRVTTETLALMQKDIGPLNIHPNSPPINIMMMEP